MMGPGFAIWSPGLVELKSCSDLDLKGVSCCVLLGSSGEWLLSNLVRPFEVLDGKWMKWHLPFLFLDWDVSS